MMKRDTGSKQSQIWLLGDSNPRNWHASLVAPFDPRHPAIHNIWTPILDEIQDVVFRNSKTRVDATSFYIRNAIEDPSHKPQANKKDWSSNINQEVSAFKGLLDKYSPKLVFSFGAFAFEFARRSLEEEAGVRYSKWGARALGQEFRDRTARFDIRNSNIIPLLHVSIARGRFLRAHEYYCEDPSANYFKYVASDIAPLLLEHSRNLRIWIDERSA